MESNGKNIVGKECVLTKYGKAKNSLDDVLLVKERIHYSDNTTGTKLIPHINYKRDFYVTKKGCRDHKQKKEWEHIDNLDQYETTQARLAGDIANVLKRNSSASLKQVCSSPYVYGADITTSSLIKHEYLTKYPDIAASMNLAVLDFEADVLKGNAEVIISGALTYKDKAILAVTEEFMDGKIDKNDIEKCFTKYLGDIVKERKINLEIHIVKTPALVAMKCMEKAHEWQPDIVGVWNIPYDMKLMIKTFKTAGILPEDIFCDPSVPPKYRHFKWNEEVVRKERAGGEEKNKHYAELWHTASHLAGFHFVDMMSLFCILRTVEGKRASYALDAILTEELEITKLKFKEADGLEGLDWHRYMQANHKAEYLVYNLFDCISVELLDEKTKDVAQKLPIMLGASTNDVLDSNPRRLVDDLHFKCLKRNRVIGSTGTKMYTELDDMVMGMKGWIVTLPSHLRDPKIGIKGLVENEDQCIDVFGMVSDLDVKGSYPTTGVIANISKETTHSELCKVEGLTEQQQRSIGINMTSPKVNALEVSTQLFGLPSADDLLDLFMEDHV